MNDRHRVEVTALSLQPDGMAVAESADGESLSVYGALPGERVQVQVRRKRRGRRYGLAEQVSAASAERVLPACAAAAVCGGCVFQHWQAERQLAFKEAALFDELATAGLADVGRLAPIEGPSLGYRHRARLGVKYVAAKGGVLVGFREKLSPLVADIAACPVLAAPLDRLIVPLRELLGGLDGRTHVPQIEVAVAETATALTLRHLQPLSDRDRQALLDFAAGHGVEWYLQSAGPDSVRALGPATPLAYRLPEFDVELRFGCLDFTQVNRVVNRRLVRRAIELLEVDAAHHVLDLFCGIGNFSLPLARRCAAVVGLEGAAALVSRAGYNARHNGIGNASFAVADLYAEAVPVALTSALATSARLLLDPPRSGAGRWLRSAELGAVERIVYVSCNPSSLAADAAVLAARGFRLQAAGVVDMFPNTAHVESVAVFARAG